MKCMLHRILILTLLVAGWSLELTAQQQLTVVKGTVRDAITKEPLAFVSVYFEGGKGVNTDNQGNFYLTTVNPRLTNVSFTYVGYKKFTKKVTAFKETELGIELEQANSMKDVVIKTKRAKYRNKNNPAVELIEKVIANKDKNRIQAYDYAQYDQYEKLELSLANRPEKIANNKLFKKYTFIVENVDTTKLEGKSLLPIYMEERVAEIYYRKNPKQFKTYLQGEKKVNYGDFVDANGITEYLKRLYADIDIYTNYIDILATQFMSPIADAAPTFYRFYIRDTTEVDGVKLVRLTFGPKNGGDLVFKGTMYVTLDGNYGVQKIDMSISKKANLNWARQVRIFQDFEKNSDNRFHVTKSGMLAEFAITQGASGGIVGERVVSFKNMQTNKPAPDSIYNGPDLVVAIGSDNQSESFWKNRRHEQLSDIESKIYSNIDSLRNMKSFKTLTNWAMIIFSGYKKFGGFEIGNTNTFYAWTPIEGFRLRVGGRTTPEFSKHVYMEGYTAYGFRDKVYKYFGGIAYSFNGKSIFGYPLNYLKVFYQYDTKIPGQDLLFASEDNFFLSIKRGNNNKWLYNRVFKIEYINEFGKNLRFSARFHNTISTPTGDIYFEKPTTAGSTQQIKDVNTTEINTELRWAPKEQFYQGKNFRRPIVNKYPIFTLRFDIGLKGVLNSEYNYQKVTVAANKRFYLAHLGYADISAEAAYQWGKVPYPLLIIHRANQTYAYQLNSYNMMNFMEFVSDRYAAANFNFYFNGFLLNRVPLLKRLKLREVASFKVLYGGLRDENNPAKSADLMNFPRYTSTGVPFTYDLNNAPYIEASVGIANILKMVRIDVVKRLNYLKNPDVVQWALRTRIRIDM